MVLLWKFLTYYVTVTLSNMLSHSFITFLDIARDLHYQLSLWNFKTSESILTR